ncbi:MAG: hypothetical protein ABEH43_06515, partial [Flavobacteriales bacterium]
MNKNINKYNYKEWIFEYIEGNLSSEQQNRLFDFLEKYPELKEELEEWEDTKLSQENIRIENKNSLKNIPYQGIDAGNITDKIIADSEGNLNKEQKNGLNYFMEDNPAYKEEHRIYNRLKLDPDLSIKFPNKQTLKKEPADYRVFWRVAASLILLIGLSMGLYLLLNDQNANNSEKLVQNSTSKEDNKTDPKDRKEKQNNKENHKGSHTSETASSHSKKENNKPENNSFIEKDHSKSNKTPFKKSGNVKRTNIPKKLQNKPLHTLNIKAPEKRITKVSEISSTSASYNFLAEDRIIKEKNTNFLADLKGKIKKFLNK